MVAMRKMMTYWCLGACIRVDACCASESASLSRDLVYGSEVTTCCGSNCNVTTVGKRQRGNSPWVSARLRKLCRDPCTMIIRAVSIEMCRLYEEHIREDVVVSDDRRRLIH